MQSHLQRLGRFIKWYVKENVVKELQHVLQSLERKNWPDRKQINDCIDGGQVGVHTSRARDGQEDAKQGRIDDVLLHGFAYQSMQCVEDISPAPQCIQRAFTGAFRLGRRRRSPVSALRLVERLVIITTAVVDVGS
jgi:hypothetical protein